jgi:hypothetical protein
MGQRYYPLSCSNLMRINHDPAIANELIAVSDVTEIMDNMPLHKIAKDKIPLNILSSLYFATLSRFKTKIPPNVKRGRERGATAAVLVACGQRACGDGWREGKEDGAAQGGRTAPPGGGGEGDNAADRGRRAPTGERRTAPPTG